MITIPKDPRQQIKERQQQLRDEFAKASLSALVILNERTNSPIYIAKEAYQIADAMLKIRGDYE